MKSKHLLLLMLLALFAPWAANAQTVTIGTGTDTQYESPMDNYYNYSFVEMIYTADEIAAGNPTENTILSVGFHLASEGLNNKTYTITVYMKNIDATSFESASHVAFASTDAVTTKNVTATTSGWVTVELDTPFTYDPTKSLLIGVNKTAGSYAGSSYKWSYTTTTEYRHLRNHQDTPAAYDPTTPPTYPTRDYKRPNVQLTFGVPPTCFAPQNLTCTEYTATSATLTWQRHANGTENAWVLQYSTDNTFATGVQSVNVSNTPSTQLTDLTAETNYYARVRPDCDENLWSDVCEFKPTAAQTVTIGSGTGTTYYFPSNTNYDYSYTQQIYTAAEIGQIGAIKSVSFKGNGAGNRTFVVYMANTTKETFADKTDVIPIADATQVFSGSVTFTANEWKTIELAGDGFDYDGGNLAIIVDDNSGNWTMGSTNWAAFSTSGNQALYFYRDSNDIDPTIPASSNNSVTNSKNQIILSILPTNTPKPRNIQVSDITASQATVSWEAPATGTPTGYEYQIKVSGNEWPTSWTSAGNNLSVEPTGLTASTTYDFRVRATYTAGNSKSIETQFTTLDDCAFPTGFAATLVAGNGTVATFSWTKGFSEDDDWVLQYGTDNTFATCTEINDGFTVSGNTVTFEATTDITPEVLHYARVKTDCGSGSYSSWTDVYEFTPSNYVDYTFRETASSTTSYVPFYGSYTTSATNQSQFVIPAAQLPDELVGGTIRSITYYTSSTTTTNWGGVTFDVYMAEVENTTFSTPVTFIDWTTLTNVYSGTVSLSNGMMTIAFDRNYTYNGGNLLIGFKTNTAGTETQSINWTAYYGSTYNEVHQYSTYNASRSYYQPKITFSYQPTPYKYPVIDEASCTAGTTTAHIAWTVTGANPTGYQYQYKTAAGEWPTNWTSVNTAYADLSGLTSGTSYDFRVKALYEGNHESAVVDYSFFTECAVVTTFPWKEDFEAYSAGDFSHPCWQNVHISGDGTYIFKVNTSTTGGNTTHQLQLPDQAAGTETMLRLPEMNLPSNDYQFVIDVFRNANTYQSYPYELEGIHVYVSTNGNLEGATELAYIPRHKDVSNTLIPAEEVEGWYTYEIPIGISGNCYIILKGVNQYITSTYMDNLTVEQIPTCARPSELASSNVTNHSATIEWTAGDAEQTLWQIAYSKTDFDPNTANFDVTTVTTIDATAHPFTLDKILDPESTYYVYVRANCGTAAEPDFGPWNRKGISFTTQVATPAPSNFVATNPASEKVDMTWNAGGGDFESWEIYYVASETAPDAPTASTTATVSNITTLPTTEAPYVLEGLNPVTKYYAWIRAKHVWNNETTYSDWVALTSSYFETLDACPTPTDLVATNLTSVSADLSWVGSDDVDSYTVQYRTAAGMGAAILSEEFASTSVPTNWTKNNGLFNETAGTATLTTDSYGWYFGTDHSLFNSNHAYVNIYGNNQKWLVTPIITLGEGNVLTFDLALTAYSSSATNPQTTGTDDKFFVLVSTDNKETWNVLRKWDNADSPYVYNEIAVAGESITLDLSSFDRQSVYIAFYGESTVTNADNNLHIDNVMVGTPTPAGNWIDATTNVEERSFQLTGLTAGTKYDVHVKSNCTSGEYCEPITFTTLAEGNMVFTNATNDGKWGTAGNWAPAQLPVLTDEVILRANATIENDCVAEAKKITFSGTPTPTLTIADGGQLITNTAVNAKVQKVINTHGETTADGGWYFIASPINSSSYSATSTGLNLITDTYGATIPEGQSATYDLYSFLQNPTLDENGVGNEWRNYRKSTFSLANGKGYLYASLNGTTLNFSGNIKALPTTASQAVSLTYASESTTQDMSYRGWNLVGNPFTFDTYVNMSYYKMNEDGSGVEPVDAYQTTTIAPCTGIMVQATETVQSITFSKDAPSAQNGKGNLNIALAQANVRNNTVMDKAVLSFNEGSQLSKFYFGQSKANIYFPQFNEELAIVQSEGMGEMPLSFRANENGSYTLSFSSEEVSFSYLHLVDNMTGNDVDLLQTPSYTFDALKLVFATGNAADDSFAFYSNGNWIINNDGQATLQVIDVTGRILSSETVNGSVSTTINAAPGVYMLRLVNGDNVKVQKVVVR